MRRGDVVRRAVHQKGTPENRAFKAALRSYRERDEHRALELEASRLSIPPLMLDPIVIDEFVDWPLPDVKWSEQEDGNEPATDQ